MVAAFLMLVGGLVGYFFGIDSENKSLEDISSFKVGKPSSKNSNGSSGNE